MEYIYFTNRIINKHTSFSQYKMNDRRMKKKTTRDTNGVQRKAHGVGCTLKRFFCKNMICKKDQFIETWMCL